MPYPAPYRGPSAASQRLAFPPVIPGPAGCPASVYPRELKVNDLVALDPGGEPIQIDVLSGSLWITQEGDGADHTRGPGSSWTSALSGKVVLQALGNTQMMIRFTPPSHHPAEVREDLQSALESFRA